MTVAPISFAETQKKNKTEIPHFPEFVIQAVNEYLVSIYSAARYSHTLKYAEVKERFNQKVEEHFKLTGEKIEIEHKFYDFEKLYSHFGWEIEVNIPAYNEAGGTTWTFRKTEKRIRKQTGEDVMAIAPVTPKTCHTAFLKSVPDFVMNAANELIKEKFAISKVFEFTIPELVQKIAKFKEMEKKETPFLVSDLNLDNRFLDLECIYNKGWDVQFVKLPYYETAPNYWIFSQKKKNPAY